MLKYILEWCLSVFFPSGYSPLTYSPRYGYVTNTKIKFIIVVNSSNITLRDNEIRSVSMFFLNKHIM